MLRIDVNSSRQLQAVLLAIRTTSNEVAKQYRQSLKAMTDQAWLEEIRGHVTTRMQSRILLETARTAVSNQNVRLSAGTVGRALSKRTGGAGAAKPADLAQRAEFGGSFTKFTTYRRRSKHGSHEVRRRTMTAWGAARRKGYVFYPAVARVVPRVASYMVQTCVRTLHEAFEGKR